jgi:integrase
MVAAFPWASARLPSEASADPARRERAAASRHDAGIFLVATSRACAAARSSRCAGERSTSRAVPSTSSRTSQHARDEDLVFPSRLGEKLDGDALSSRYVKSRDAAGLPLLRFHDLRHTVGSLAVDGGASIVQVKAWMGHADVKTTMRYLHSKSRAADAAMLDSAFATTILERPACTA